ncbi:MAG: hypothetical protein Q9217_001832 [Psora testacea]
MPPRIAIHQYFHYSRPITAQLGAVKTTAKQIPLCLRPVPRRSITSDEKPLPEAQKGTAGPNQEQLPHVSEEAAATAQVTGEGGPELEQGTPVEEVNISVLKRDDKAHENAPKVMQEGFKTSSPKGSRLYSTSSRRKAQEMMDPVSSSVEGEPPMMDPISSSIRGQGHVFGLPKLPLPSKLHLKHRYDPIVHQVTNLLMRNGKLSAAQRNMAMILERLRTAAPPSTNPQRPLLPGAPPTTHLPLNPVLYLTLAIDSVAPLMRIRSQKGAAGGGVALQIPVPLGLRQRRRIAVKWILDAVSKRRSKGSGRSMFPNKVADELISIVEGKSSVWERRGGVHRLGVNARANLSYSNARRR